MLAKANRLVKNKDFSILFQRGKSSINNITGLKIIQISRQQSANRFGILISNKVSKKAVKRNKIKRQIRAIIRSWQNQIKPNFDLLIIAYPAIIDQTFEQIEQSIIKNLKKLNLLKEN